MNPETKQDQMPEYFTKLPQAVQDIVTAGEWEKRATEIAQKYSLTPDQTENFLDHVLMVLVGLEQPQEFPVTLIDEIGISKLLATQIIDELGKRVFEYALKMMESTKPEQVKQEMKANPTLQSSQTKPQSVPDATPSIVGGVPEIPPNDLPMVEKGEVAHDSSKQRGASSEEGAKLTAEIKKSPEPIQRPMAVPRFSAVALDETGNIEKTPEPQAKAVPSQTPAQPVKPASPQAPTPPAPKKYDVDPYREPIE